MERDRGSVRGARNDEGKGGSVDRPVPEYQPEDSREAEIQEVFAGAHVDHADAGGAARPAGAVVQGGLAGVAGGDYPDPRLREGDEGTGAGAEEDAGGRTECRAGAGGGNTTAGTARADAGEPGGALKKISAKLGMP